jgi:hypothetical protein
MPAAGQRHKILLATTASMNFPRVLAAPYIAKLQ